MTSQSIRTMQFGFPADGKLADVSEMMRAISALKEPDDIFREYVQRIRQFFPVDKVLILSDLSQDDSPEPQYGVAVMHDWERPLQPWSPDERFEPLPEGLLKSLFQNGIPTIVQEIDSEISEEEAFLLEGMHSLRAVPMYRDGEVQGMVIGLKTAANAFTDEELSVLVWLANMFGRAMENLSLARKLEGINKKADQEFRGVGEIQQNLLPETTPELPTLELATYYQTSQRAGGDYYDFFPQPDGRLGIFIADVSGHGTPAAVVMAMMNGIAHTYTGPHENPSDFLNYLNQHLSQRFTAKTGTFITAFYAIFDPTNRKLSYASAGHNPPLRRGCSSSQVMVLNKAGRMPLGISADITYDNANVWLSPGDRVVLFTDGIVEAYGKNDEMFGTERLGDIIGRCDLNSTTIVDAVCRELKEFTGQERQNDDCTLVVMKVK